MMVWDGFLCRVVGRNFPLRIIISTHIHPINNLWGGFSPSRRGVPCWFVLCPLKYLQETMLLLRVAPRGAERCCGAAERTGRCLHLSPQMLEG